MKYFYLSLFVVLNFILTGCNNSAVKDDANLTEVEFMYQKMQEVYLWNDTLPNYSKIQLNEFNTSNQFLETVRYEDDRWSYIEDKIDYDNKSNQIDSGFGCYYSFDELGNVYIKRVDFDSPCDSANIQRGDRIVAINDISIKNITNEYYNQIKSDIDNESIFRIERDALIIDAPITPKVYTYKTVKSQIIHQNEYIVGHMIYESFTTSSSSEIDEAFDIFKENNVTELILDLRYNGGGSLSVASILLDKLGGGVKEDSIQFRLEYNADLNGDENDYGYFVHDKNSLDLDRIFILTTNATASASELVINSLKPYIDVILIGDNTHGKPVGMSGYNYNDRVFWPITFKIVNANFNGDYFNGFSPDCYVDDNINFLRSDISGDMLRSALVYLVTGKCD